MRLINLGRSGVIRWRFDRRRLAEACCSTLASTSRRPEKGARPEKYDSTYVESEWYDWWQRTGRFEWRDEDGQREKPFSMCLPPPNVTGDLHIGHALTVAIEDVLVRWHRMKGRSTVWIPGCDHAGIATQVVVEKQLMRERNIRRVDMARDEFVRHCLRWKETKVEKIQTQLKRLGAALDWSRSYYTMDEKFSTAVTEAFLRLHERGHIFRTERLVNWCPHLKSTLSDVEVEKTTIDCEKNPTLRLPGRKEPIVVGRLFRVKYKLLDDDNGYLSVVTTRPETIPADVALAVHPNDQRYAKYVGRFVENPLTPERTIPIVADEQVDPDYGTGVLKVTPAHDWTDFEIGTRHRLPLNIRCLTEDGKFDDRYNSIVAKHRLVGLDRFDARDKIATILDTRGRLGGITQQIEAVLPLCQRTGDVVEPMLKQQWFVDCRSMAKRAIEAVDTGRLRITPAFQETVWRNWLNRTTDWCISRQLWWGHRIPAYRLRGDSSTTDEWYCGRDAAEALRNARTAHPDRRDWSVDDLEQDDDVLDTWFSSALVPLVAAGWPKSTSPIFPLSLMETGHDILPFWVTRMVMLGLELTDDDDGRRRLPFDEILLHGIVFDKNGQKMSKSLGNVLDPLDFIDGIGADALTKRIEESSLSPEKMERSIEDTRKEFPGGILKCGTDALRFMLLKQDVVSDKLSLDPTVIINGRKFCNKLWQAFTFMERTWESCANGDGWKPDECEERVRKNFDRYPAVERWLLSRLGTTAINVDTRLGKYEFAQAHTAMYEFAWFDLCDLYLEWTKRFIRSPPNDGAADGIENGQERRRIIGDVLFVVADVYVRSLAPFMPFLTEELFGRLIDVRRKYGGEEIDEEGSIHDRSFPIGEEFPFVQESIEKQMTIARRIVDTANGIRIEFGLPSGFNKKQPLSCVLFADEFIREAADTFREFMNVHDRTTVKESRTEDASINDLQSGHLWKSIDTNFVLAFEVKEADRHAVNRRIEAQIERLRKKRGEHETSREKSRRILTGEHRVRRVPNSIDLQRQIEQAERRLEETDQELTRLTKMYESLREKV